LKIQPMISIPSLNGDKSPKTMFELIGFQMR
jgi:hypothetical protein